MKPKQKPSYWTGPRPKACDICTKPLTDAFVDGRTVEGPWAIMCSSCLTSHGVGLGTGCGQLYDLNTGRKIAG